MPDGLVVTIIERVTFSLEPEVEFVPEPLVLPEELLQPVNAVAVISPANSRVRILRLFILTNLLVLIEDVILYAPPPQQIFK